jgi:hypothetical protein
MIFVSVLDLAIAVALGPVAAVLYKKHYRRSSENWYLVFTIVVAAVLWGNVAAENLANFGYWSFVGSATQLPTALGISYILSYPLWFRAAGELTFILVGRQPDQGGILWVFRIRDRTAPISPSWMSPEDAEKPDTGDDDQQ